MSSAFTESNTVEAYLDDLLSGPVKSPSPQPLSHGERGFRVVQDLKATYGRSHQVLGWHRIASADIPRQPQEVMVEPWVRDALIRLNPEIAAQPEDVPTPVGAAITTDALHVVQRIPRSAGHHIPIIQRSRSSC